MLETAWESRWLPDSLGGLAQLGERLPCKQEVTSSKLVFSTEGSSLSWLERTPDKREVGGSSPLEPTKHLENCIEK